MRYSPAQTICGVNRFSAWMLAATIVFIGAASVRGQGLFEYEFTGVVTDTSGDMGIFGPFGAVQLNDVFTGRFSYMTGPGNPDQEMSDPDLGVYNVGNFVIDQAVVAITPHAIGVTHWPGTPTLPPLPPALGTDGLSVHGSFLLGEDAKGVSLKLEAPYQTVFTDDSLPTSLTLTDFTDAKFVRSIRVVGIEPGGMSQIDQGQLTSLVKVPEPSSGALVLLGVGGGGLMRRRHKRAATLYHTT